MPYIQQNSKNGQYTITIPKKVIEKEGWRAGMEVSLNKVSETIQPLPGEFFIRPTGFIKEKS